MPVKQQEKRRFLSIVDGKIREKTLSGTPNASSRVLDDGKVVHEFIYSEVAGVITNFYFTEHKEYGVKVNIVLTDDTDTFVLQLSENSRYYADFLHVLPNIDFDVELVISPYKFEDGDNTRIGVSFKQDGEKIPSYFKELREDKFGKKYNEFVNGYPEYTGEQGDKAQFKIYLLQTKVFLKKFAMEIKNSVFPEKTVKSLAQNAANSAKKRGL